MAPVTPAASRSLSWEDATHQILERDPRLRELMAGGCPSWALGPVQSVAAATRATVLRGIGRVPAVMVQPMNGVTQCHMSKLSAPAAIASA